MTFELIQLLLLKRGIYKLFLNKRKEFSYVKEQVLQFNIKQGLVKLVEILFILCLNISTADRLEEIELNIFKLELEKNEWLFNAKLLKVLEITVFWLEMLLL